METLRCNECDYLDFCSLLITPREESCEAIKACTKEFLYDKLWDELGKYCQLTIQND